MRGSVAAMLALCPSAASAKYVWSDFGCTNSNMINECACSPGSQPIVDVEECSKASKVLFPTHHWCYTPSPHRGDNKDDPVGCFHAASPGELCIGIVFNANFTSSEANEARSCQRGMSCTQLCVTTTEADEDSAPAALSSPEAAAICPVDTGGTCSFAGCAVTRGPTTCTGGECICQDGYCATAGICKKPMMKEMATTEVVATKSPPLNSAECSACQYVANLIVAHSVTGCSAACVAAAAASGPAAAIVAAACGEICHLIEKAICDEIVKEDCAEKLCEEVRLCPKPTNPDVAGNSSIVV